MTNQFNQALAAYAIQHGSLTPPQPEPEQPQPVLAVVPADTGSRLAQLIAERARLTPAVKEATDALKEINDAIKGELIRARPDADEMLAVAEGLPPLRLYPKFPRRLNQDRLKRERPDVFTEYYETPDRPQWTLEVKK